jgi:hypothetical protein
MDCPTCGAPVAADANYCSRCGVALRPGLARPGASDPWETCQIRAEHLRGVGVFSPYTVFAYFAEATGPRGVYRAATSPEFEAIAYNIVLKVPISPRTTREPCEETLKAFIATLAENGWEPIGEHGDHWYSHRFRRRARA